MQKASLTAALILFVALSLNASHAQQVEEIIPTESKSSAPIEITANEVTYYTQRKLYVAMGEVIIKQGDELTIYAERAGFDANTQVAEAEGDVRLITPKAEMKANKMKVQLNTKCGLVINGKLKIVGDDYNVYLSGLQIEKLSENRYKVKHGTYHTCECNDSPPSWRLYSKSADIKLNSSGLLQQAVFFAGPVPLVYFPYLVVPVIVERKSGFLAPTIGRSTRSGNYVAIPYFWAISPSSDLTISTTYYELRGLELSGDYRFWAPTDWRGEINVDFIEDRRYEDRRWRISYDEDHRFLPTVGTFGHLEFVSDSDYIKDFAQRTKYRYFQFLESHLTLYGYTNFIDSYADLNLYQNLAKSDNPLTPEKEQEEFDNSSTPQRAPEIGARIMGVNLLDMFMLRASLEMLNIDRDHRQSPFEMLIAKSYLEELNKSDEQRSILEELADLQEVIPIHSQRLRLSPEAMFYLPLFNLFSFRAFLKREDDLYRTAELERDNHHRGFFEYGSILTFPISRVFALKLTAPNEEEKENEVKEKFVERSIGHLIEPGVSYIRRPKIENQNELPYIDAYDRLPEVEQLNIFTNQYLIFRNVPYQGLPLLLRSVELRVTQPVDFYAQREGEPEDIWAPLESELIFLMSTVAKTKILTAAKTEYNHELGNFTLLGILAAFETMNLFDLKVDYRRKLNDEGDETINSLKGEAGLNFFDRVGLRAGAIFEMMNGITVENHQSASYTSAQKCWKVELARREVAEPHEITYQLLLDLTGLLQVRLSQ